MKIDDPGAGWWPPGLIAPGRTGGMAGWGKRRLNRPVPPGILPAMHALIARFAETVS